MTRSSRPARIDALESRQLMTAIAWGIDSSLSHLTIAARASVPHADSVKLNSQVDGLDTASFEGTLRANITSKGIIFNGGSEIKGIAHDGDYGPGTGDAVYAVDGKYKKIITLATVKAAVRSLTLDISNTSRKAAAGAKKLFAIRNGTIQATDGSIDYKLDSKFGDADGSKSISGSDDDFKRAIDTTYGRITGGRGQRIITVPISVTFKSDLDSDVVGTFTLTGQIVAREDMASGQSVDSYVPAATFSATPIATKTRRTAEDVLA